MAIHQWPSEERPREKLLAKGPAALSDAEILAIFLRTGRKGLTAVDLARELLKHFGSLRELVDADEEAFCSNKGLGRVKYSQIQAAIELGKRYIQSDLEKNDTFTSPELTREFLTMKLRAYPYEVFACLYLDNRHRLICYEELFRGTIDSAQVHAREVVRAAIQHNAAAVIFSHNHPSGVAEPSQSDIHLTKQLAAALKLIDVRVLDHMVVGGAEAISLAERGLM